MNCNAIDLLYTTRNSCYLYVKFCQSHSSPFSITTKSKINIRYAKRKKIIITAHTTTSFHSDPTNLTHQLGSTREEKVKEKRNYVTARYRGRGKVKAPVENAKLLPARVSIRLSPAAAAAAAAAPSFNPGQRKRADKQRRNKKRVIYNCALLNFPRRKRIAHAAAENHFLSVVLVVARAGSSSINIRRTCLNIAV